MPGHEPSGAASTQVALEGVTRRWADGGHGVRGLSLEAPPGRLTVLLGPSGAGKSTALALVAGLVRPTAGVVRFDGIDLTPVPPERRRAALVFQDHRVFPHLSVLDNVAFGPRMRGAGRAAREAAARAALELVQLGGLAARAPDTLSGGERQRVALARALASAPRVLLLDEPLASLDAGLRAELRAMLRRVQRATRVTTIAVTHDQDEAVALADHLVLLRDGAAVQSGAPDELLDRPVDAWTARFMGATNLVAGTRRGTRVETALGTLAAAPAGSAAADGPVWVVLRPERLVPRAAEGVATSALAGPATAAGRAAAAELRAPRAGAGVRMVVRAIERRAHHLRLTLGRGEVTLVAHVRPSEAVGLAPGDALDVAVALEAAWTVARPAGES